jgi:hypothetical protein
MNTRPSRPRSFAAAAKRLHLSHPRDPEGAASHGALKCARSPGLRQEGPVTRCANPIWFDGLAVLSHPRRVHRACRCCANGVRFRRWPNGSSRSHATGGPMCCTRIPHHCAGMAAVKAGRRLGIPVVYEIRAFWEDAAAGNGTGREGSAKYWLTRDPGKRRGQAAADRVSSPSAKDCGRIWSHAALRRKKSRSCPTASILICLAILCRAIRPLAERTGTGRRTGDRLPWQLLPLRRPRRSDRGDARDRGQSARCARLLMVGGGPADAVLARAGRSLLSRCWRNPLRRPRAAHRSGPVLLAGRCGLLSAQSDAPDRTGNAA